MAIAAQTQPSKSASKGAPAKPASFLIQGILAGQDGIPLEKWPSSTSVTAYPVSKDQEHSDRVTMTITPDGRLLFFEAELQANGRFQIRVKRGDVPKNKKLKLMMSRMVGTESGTRALQKDGKDILIDAAAAPAALNLGKVTIQQPPEN